MRMVTARNRGSYGQVQRAGYSASGSHPVGSSCWKAHLIEGGILICTALDSEHFQERKDFNLTQECPFSI